ncbi:MAG: hypothetical protein PSW75_08675 [bacterium]|nr:hypothetical protein [bacterium]MDI1335520.1 hypothetical protein [Lacunisphaera sp.]
MKTKLFCLAGLLAIAAARVSAAESPAKDSSTVLFENDKVRTILYVTGTGKNVCGFGLHSHPPHLFIMKTAGKLRVTTPDGKESIEEAKAGDVGWEPAVTHRIEAISPEPVEVYLVEVKDKDWKPSTGLHL